MSAPKLAVSPEEAAAMLSMSRDHFDSFVRDEVRVIRAGRKVLVPVRELERWVERNAARSLEGAGRDVPRCLAAVRSSLYGHGMPRLRRASLLIAITLAVASGPVA